jgi:hypothetical protein
MGEFSSRKMVTQRMKNNSGYNLLEVLITTALAVVIVTGFAQVLQSHFQQQQNLSYNERKQDILLAIINMINNNVAWQNTVDYSANTNLNCLKDKAKFPAIANAGACVFSDGGKFALVDDTGNVFLDDQNPSAGFSLSMGPCNSYSSSGDDVCPIRAEISWRPLCINCRNNPVEITINLMDTPRDRKTVASSLITRTLVRYQRVYDPDLVLHMKLDGTVGASETIGNTIADTSKFKNDGAITEYAAGGPLPTYFAGRVGQSLNFDSGGPSTWKWISVPDSSSLRPTTLTVSVWAKWTGGAAMGPAGLVDKHFSGQFDSYVLRWYDATKFQFCVAEADPGPSLVSRCLDTNALALAKNIWYHVAATWDGQTVKTYVNGILQGPTLAYSGPNYWSTSPLHIGTEFQQGSADPYAPSFPGVIDDVKVWRRALSAAEIQKEYSNP